MILHGLIPSPFSRKVVVVLEEKGIAHETRDLEPFPKRDELADMNPLQLIPILEHDGRLIPDSSVIVAYLERLYPNRSVYPSDLRDYAQALFLEEYSDTCVTDAIAPVFRERFVKPHAMNEEPDESIVKSAMNEGLPPVFDYLESRLETGRSTFLNEFTVADAALGTTLTSLHLANEQIDPTKWPKLVAYHAALLERPSFQKALPMAA